MAVERKTFLWKLIINAYFESLTRFLVQLTVQLNYDILAKTNTIIKFKKFRWNNNIVTGPIYGIAAGIGITAGGHRLWAHRSYSARLPLRILLAHLYCMAGMVTINNFSWAINVTCQKVIAKLWNLVAWQKVSCFQVYGLKQTYVHFCIQKTVNSANSRHKFDL